MGALPSAQEALTEGRLAFTVVVTELTFERREITIASSNAQAITRKAAICFIVDHLLEGGSLRERSTADEFLRTVLKAEQNQQWKAWNKSIKIDA